MLVTAVGVLDDCKDAGPGTSEVNIDP